MLNKVTAIAMVLLFAPAALSAPAEVADAAVRPGVTMRYLALGPAGQPRAAVILLAGGNGALRLSPSGSIGSLGGNFGIEDSVVEFIADWIKTH